MIQSVGIQPNQYPVEEQLQNLGLDTNSLSGKRVLDIGCGKSARLVRYLREYVIEAEGIDDEIWGDTYTINRDWRKIPREDGVYDVVVSHMALSILGSALRVDDAAGKITKNQRKHIQRWAEDLFLEGIREALRVMKPDGSFVYFPASFGSLRRKALDIVTSAGYCMEEEQVPISRAEYFVHPLTSRVEPQTLQTARVEYAHRTAVRKMNV